MMTRDALIERLAFNAAVGSKYREFLHPRLKGKWRSKGAVKPGPSRTIFPAAHPTSGAQTTSPTGKAAEAAIAPKPDQGSAAGKSNMAHAEFRSGKLVMRDGSSVPEHIAKLKIPPAWTSVRVATDANASLLAQGVDAKGRSQSIYSDAHWAKSAATKFARVQELIAKKDEIAAQNAANQSHEDHEVRENADVMALILATGIRPGSARDTKANKRAYGATTLEGRHVVDVDGTVRLRFTGKKGVALDIPVHDADVARMLMERKKKAGDSGMLFDTDAGKLLKYAHTLDGGKFKTKDFRTLIGTTTAILEIRKVAEKPKTKKEYVKRVKDVAKIVAAKLGNTVTVALQSYIDPSVFSPWRTMEA